MARRRFGGVVGGTRDPGAAGRGETWQRLRQGGCHHAPNAMDNFCFEVTLSYRRLERPRRAAGSQVTFLVVRL
jgi:hypothetical protein